MQKEVEPDKSRTSPELRRDSPDRPPTTEWPTKKKPCRWGHMGNISAYAFGAFMWCAFCIGVFVGSLINA